MFIDIFCLYNKLDHSEPLAFDYVYVWLILYLIRYSFRKWKEIARGIADVKKKNGRINWSDLSWRWDSSITHICSLPVTGEVTELGAAKEDLLEQLQDMKGDSFNFR